MFKAWRMKKIEGKFMKQMARGQFRLDLHMDLIYYESAPGLQGLHAYLFDDSVGGGYSLLLDVFAFAGLYLLRPLNLQ